MKCDVLRQTATWLQQADHISVLFRVTAGRSYPDLIPILYRVTAGQSYFRTWRNACVTAGKTTMAAGKINYRCFELLS